MAQALPFRVMHPQQFTAPSAAVDAHAYAVQRDAENGAIQRVLGHHGGHMSVVVLHGDGGDATLGGKMSMRPML